MKPLHVPKKPVLEPAFQANAKRKLFISMYSVDIYNKSMRVSVLPKTPLGKWSTELALAFLVLLIAFLLLVASGQRGGETF